MGGILPYEPVAGFDAPVHRALTEPILLGGAPRAVAIANGTLAAAVGLGLRLWIPGLVIWAIGHAAAVWAAKHNSSTRCAAICTTLRISGREPMLNLAEYRKRPQPLLDQRLVALQCAMQRLLAGDAELRQ